MMINYVTLNRPKISSDFSVICARTRDTSDSRSFHFLFCLSVKMDASFVTYWIRTPSESTSNDVEEGSHRDDVEVDSVRTTDNGQGQLILECDWTSRNSVVPTTLEVFLKDTASQRRRARLMSIFQLSKHDQTFTGDASDACI